MWALTKYCAERTHFTPNIPLKILLSLLTAAVAVATYSVVFTFAVLKLVGTGLQKVWLTINDPAFNASIAEELSRDDAYCRTRDDDEVLTTHRIEYTPAGRDIFGDWHEESWHDNWD